MKEACMKEYYVYIMTNRRCGVLYTGVTNDLGRRVQEHRDESLEGFTHRYHLKHLVYFETWPDANQAIAREKQIKGLLRKKKIALIEEMNPEWRDLSETMVNLRLRF
jgi:putative endonuclease